MIIVLYNIIINLIIFHMLGSFDYEDHGYQPAPLVKVLLPTCIRIMLYYCDLCGRIKGSSL